MKQTPKTATPTPPAKGTKAPKTGTTSRPRVPRGKGIPVVIKGYTLSDIARAINVNQSYLSKVSRGIGTPSLHVLEDARVFLGFDTIDETLQALLKGARESC